MAKQSVGQVNKKEDAEREAFWKDIKEVQEKHQLAIGAYMEYTAFGIAPVIGAKKVEKKPEIVRETEENPVF